MINNKYTKAKKLEQLLKITNISEEEIEKLDYKEKQKYYKAKSKLCRVSFVSRDKDGNGITYKKIG